MTVAESQDGVGCLDVTHGDLPVWVVVAPTEGVDVGLLFPVIIVFGHGPVDRVVFQLEGSEEVHGGAGERCERREVRGEMCSGRMLGDNWWWCHQAGDL